MFRLQRPPKMHGRGWADDPNRPDAERVYIAVNELRAAATLVASTDGLERLGLGVNADTRLMLLRERLSVQHGTGTLESGAGGLLVATTAGLLEDALYATYLPNHDASVIAQINAVSGRSRRDKEVDSSTAQELHGLRERLHRITLIVQPDRLRVRNRIAGLDIETSVPVRTNGFEIPAEGLAFQLRHGVLYDIFVRRSASAEPSSLFSAKIAVADLRNGQRDDLVFCRYDPIGKQLELFIGTTRLVVETVPEIVPDATLASLAADAPKRRLPAMPIADVIARTGRLGRVTKPVTQENGYIVGEGGRGIVALQIEQPDNGTLAIPAALASLLSGVFRRLREGATIRADANHNYVEKGPTTVAFPTAIPIANSLDDVLCSLQKSDFRVRVYRQELLNGLLLGTAMAGDAAAALQATLEFKHDPEPAVVQTVTLKRSNSQGVCTTTVDPIQTGVQTCHARIIVGLDISIWLSLLTRARAEFLDLLVNGDRSIMAVTHGSGENTIHTFFGADIAEPEKLECPARP